MNWSSGHICLPIKIKSSTNEANNIAANIITGNNFFIHWIKEIDIKCYRDDLQILQTNNATDIYRYSDTLLKHMPKETLKTFFYTVKKIYWMLITIEDLIILMQTQEQMKI